jgi:G3E family GTPase
MKIVILSGFLGSGKTSVLLQLAGFLTSETSGNQTTKVAIIENEIGSVDIDGKTLRAQGFEVRELLSGCVCCSLSDTLAFGIAEIQATVDPDWLLIETTGLACAQQVKEGIQTSVDGSLDIFTLTLIDAGRFLDLMEMIAPMLERQLVGADVILINKVDLVDEHERALLHTRLESLNPTAFKVETTANTALDPSVWEQILGDRGETDAS